MSDISQRHVETYNDKVVRQFAIMVDAALDGKPSVRPHGEPPETHALQLR
jgi:hypothetical protein